MVFDVMNRT